MILSKKIFVLVASIAIALSFISLTYSLQANNSSEEKEFQLPIEAVGFSDGTKINLNYENGFEKILINSENESFCSISGFKGNENVSVLLLTSKDILLWESNLVVKQGYKMVFSNSSGLTGMQFEYKQVEE